MNDSNKNDKIGIENVLEASIRAWSALVDALALSGTLDRRVLCEKIKEDIDKIDGKADARTVVAMRRFLVHVLVKPDAVDSFSEFGAMLRKEPLEPPSEEPQPQPFRIGFSDALLEHLKSKSTDRLLADALPGFSEAQVGESDEAVLMLGYYERALARDQGAFQLFESSGIHFVIPQIRLREKLMGRTIDIQNGRVVITGSVRRSGLY